MLVRVWITIVVLISFAFFFGDALSESLSDGEGDAFGGGGYVEEPDPVANPVTCSSVVKESSP